jgi:hypothetical protein
VLTHIPQFGLLLLHTLQNGHLIKWVLMATTDIPCVTCCMNRFNLGVSRLIFL